MKVLTIFFVLFYINCRSDADEDRKTKVLACINLTKAALHHDKEYFLDISLKLDASDKNELPTRRP